MLILTPREREVIVLMVSGKRPKDIAAELGISIKTFSTYRARILRRNQLITDQQLGFLAGVTGMIDSDFKSDRDTTQMHWQGHVVDNQSVINGWVRRST